MTPKLKVNSCDVSTKELVLGFDHVQLYVGNAYQAARYFETDFGFEPLERAGLDTGSADTVSYLLGNGNVRIIVTSATRACPVADYVHKHGDSVTDVALAVEDVDVVYERAVKNGAKAVMEPAALKLGTHEIRKAIVGTPGELVHSLVQSSDSRAVGLPNGRKLDRAYDGRTGGFEKIDHTALAVGQGELDSWVAFYESAFGFQVRHEEITSTGMTAMRSKVVENSSRTVKFPIVEPAPSRKASQVEEFVQFHKGAGVQHLAVLCDDICQTVQMLRTRGVQFLNVPDTYYDMLSDRIGEVGDQLKQLRESRVLLDRDEWGDLLQTFSTPVTGRPTLFFELIQRNGGRGFGSGNIRALFEAVEREQAARAGW